MTDVRRVAIVGARDASEETLRRVRELVKSLPDDAVVISGGAEGVDAEAATWAGLCDLATETFGPHCVVACLVPSERIRHPHNLSRRDRLIGRNTLIAIACTEMHAFVTGSKGGTWDSVRQAKRFRRPCWIYEDGKPKREGDR